MDVFLYLCKKNNNNILTVCLSDVGVYFLTHKNLLSPVCAVTEKTACSHSVCMVCLWLPATIQRQTSEICRSVLSVGVNVMVNCCLSLHVSPVMNC